LELPVLHRVGHAVWASVSSFMELMTSFFAEVSWLLLMAVVDGILTIWIIIDSGSFDI
jgi:hypothetical protein